MKIVIKILGGCLITLIVVLVLLYLALRGTLPGFYDLIGINKPQDLGVTYSQADVDSMIEKTAIEYSSVDAEGKPENSLVFEGSHEVSTSFDSAELTGFLNEQFKDYVFVPVKDSQIKVNEDGSVELSSVILKDNLVDFILASGGFDSNTEIIKDIVNQLPIDLPVYAKIKGEVKDDKVTSLVFSDLSISKYNVPVEYVNNNISVVTSFIEGRLNYAEGLQVDSARVENGEIVFEGMMPDEQKIYKK